MQKVDEAITTTKKVVGKFKREIPYILIMLFSIALTGIIELVRFGWSWEVLKNADFWANMGLTNVSAFLMALSSTLMTSDVILMNTYDGLGKQAYDLDSKLNEVRLSIKNDIDIFLEQINRERKIKAWKNQINKKLLKQKNCFNEKDSREYAKYLKGLSYIKRYRVEQRIKLEQKITDEYINKNIDVLRVKYGVITRRMIENNNFSQEETETLTSSTKVLISGILPKFLLSTSFTVFFSSFIYEVRDGISIATILPILVKLLTLFFNFAYGRNFAPHYVEQTTINNLLVRREWLTKYADWREKENGKTNMVS